MSIYKIKETKKRKILFRKMLVNSATMLITIIFGFSIGIIKHGTSFLSNSIFVPVVLFVFGIVIIIIVVGNIVYKKNLVDVVVKTDNAILTIIQGNNRNIDIEFSEIERIEKYNNEFVNIVLKDKSTLRLSKNLEDFDKLLSELNMIVPVEVKNRRTFVILGAICLLLLFCVFYLSTKSVILLLSGSIIILSMISIGIYIIANKSNPKKLKIIVLLCVIVLIINNGLVMYPEVLNLMKK